MAATNRVLEDLVEAGTFRSDLMYRLNLYTIHLSPLRDRQEDILPLATHFLSLYATRRGLQFNPFSEDVQALLLSYDYPGNVRELRNAEERGMWNPSGPVCVKRYNRICRQPPCVLFPS